MLVIKKINQGLQKNAKNLISGNLGFTVVYSKDKIKDERALVHSEEVFVALKQRRLEWFLREEKDVARDEAESSKTYRCLGFVDLDQIIKVKEVGSKS